MMLKVVVFGSLLVLLAGLMDWITGGRDDGENK
jgi:hypothetical protein